MKKLKLVFLFGIIASLFNNCKNPNQEASEQQSDAPKPNIVLILADDLGYSDIGCFGAEVNTPNLDRLAEGGMRFTQVYNTSKCFPSRASLLTGAYAHQVNMGSGPPKKITDAITLGNLLQQAGYYTMWSGKHHGTQNPITLGFDHYYGLRDGACNHFNPGEQRPGEGQPAQKRPDRTWCIDDECFSPYTPEAEDFYTTDYFTNYALQWLDEPQLDEKPFFLYLAYTAPHDPLMAWPEDIAKYEGKYKGGFAALRQQRFEKQKAMGLVDENYELPEPQHVDWESLSQDEKAKEERKMEVYAAMIDRLDQNIGRVLDKIKVLGKEENTLVIFVSDNGASAEVVNIDGSGEIGTLTRWTSLGPDWANVGNTPLRYYKNYSYEGGIRTPMVAYWPKGIQNQGSFNRTPLHFIDFMTTFASLAGVEYPAGFNENEVVEAQGIDFSPLFKNESVTRNKPLFWQWAKGRAVRDGDWKMVAWDGEWELYNLAEDPTETTNLVEQNQEQAIALQEAYETWASEVGVDK